MDFTAQVFAALGNLLRKPFDPFVDGTTVLHWPYLVSSAVLVFGLALIAAVARPGGGRVFLGEVFAKSAWWSDSSRADYVYFLINIIIFPILFAPAIFTVSTVGGETRHALDALLGIRATPLLSEKTALVSFTVLYFVAYDFGRYLAHLALHKNALLWEFHKVHHSAQSLNPITSFRQHPVDLIVMGLGGNLFGGLVTGSFLYIDAGRIGAYTVLGTHALIAVYNLIGNLRHSHAWLDYGALDYLFVSPAQHQIHHSALPQHRDKNCVFALAIWDRMFGTHYIPNGHERFPMGLGDGTDGTWHHPWRLYWWPVVGAARVVKGRLMAASPGRD